MRNPNRKYIAITLFVIAGLSLLVWGFSKYIQPILPPELNSYLVLYLAALIGVVTVLTNIPDIYQKIVKLFSGDKGNTFESPTEKQNHRNREIMLARVQDAWVEGVLKKSLCNEVKMRNPEHVAHFFRMTSFIKKSNKMLVYGGN